MLVCVTPKAGFCIKSTVLSSGISQHRKVFVNIAWDQNVPPPPDGSEDVIQKAMSGEDHTGWYVPVIVSAPREDKDKAGIPSLVFDCVFHSSIKSRSFRDPEFKLFIIELSLQRIEAQSGLTLSRSIGTPNIASKGKLLPRSVQIPASILSARSSSDEAPKSQIDADTSKSPLIQELSSGTQSFNEETSNSLRGILKSSTSPPKSVNYNNPLFWTWSIVDNDPPSNSQPRIKFQVHIPDLSVPMVASSTLHISPRTLELIIPDRRPLSLDLSLSDAEIASRLGTFHSSSIPSSASDAEIQTRKTHQQEETSALLQLKRQRDFDVHGAEAEWKIGSGVLVIYV